MGHCHWKQHIEDYTRPRPVAVKTMTLRKTATKKAILRKLLNQYVDFFFNQKNRRNSQPKKWNHVLHGSVLTCRSPRISFLDQGDSDWRKNIYTHTHSYVCLCVCVCKCVGNYVCLFLVTSLMCDTRFFTYLQNA